MWSREGLVTFARRNLKAQGITCVNEVIPYVHYIAATGGRFRPTPITVLLERGEGFFRVGPTLWKAADQKKKDRRKQYSGRRRQMQAASDSQPCDVTQSLVNNISPPKLIWSAQPRCWPRSID